MSQKFAFAKSRAGNDPGSWYAQARQAKSHASRATNQRCREIAENIAASCERMAIMNRARAERWQQFGPRSGILVFLLPMLGLH